MNSTGLRKGLNRNCKMFKTKKKRFSRSRRSISRNLRMSNTQTLPKYLACLRFPWKTLLPNGIKKSQLFRMQLENRLTLTNSWKVILATLLERSSKVQFQVSIQRILAYQTFMNHLQLYQRLMRAYSRRLKGSKMFSSPRMVQLAAHLS